MTIERWGGGAVGSGTTVAHAGLIWTVANTRQPALDFAAQVDGTLAVVVTAAKS